jgi:hypothetical protein
MLCIRKIIKGFKSDGNIDTKFFENTPNYDYLIDGSPVQGTVTDKNMFKKEQFISDAYKSVAGWTSEDLDKILQLMIDYLVAKESMTKIKFDSIYQLPEIPNFDLRLGPFEWIKAFFNCCKDFNQNGLDLKGLEETYETLNITKILNERSEMDETDAFFKQLSLKIVSVYGIEAFESLMDFMSKLSSKDNSDELVTLSLRHKALEELFSKLIVDENNNQERFDLVANTLKAEKSLSLGALKLLADFIKETEINEWNFTKEDLVKMSNLILQDLDDEQFAQVLIILKSKIESLEKPAAIESLNRSDHESECIADIRALKTDSTLNIAAACNKALNSITGALEKIYKEHKALGTVCLIEKASVETESGEIQDEEFLRSVAVSHELEQQLLSSRSAKSSIEMQVYNSKTFKILESPPTEGTSILFDPSKGHTASELSLISIPILTKLQESIGTVTIKLEGQVHKFDDHDATFITKALDQLFEIINDIKDRNKQ